MLNVIRMINQDKDRCILIGRNAFNFLLAQHGEKGQLFPTNDYDLACPDIESLKECESLLEQIGFVADGSIFQGPPGELDILLVDSDYPQGVVDHYYNIPSLRSLWDARQRKDGILTPPKEVLFLNKLLYMRDDEGKDAATITLYLKFYPEQFTPLLEAIETHPDWKERGKMLYSLYESVVINPKQRETLEKCIVRDINTNKKTEYGEIVWPFDDEANINASDTPEKHNV